MSKKKIILRSY